MKLDHKFVQSSELGASRVLRDSCLKCGKTETAHAPIITQLAFRHGNKWHIFNTWEDAHAAGFFDGEDLSNLQDLKRST
jgi:hypothetical protein